MKYFIIFFLSLNFIFYSACANIIDPCSKEGSLILVDESGKILFENQADKLIYPASLTKMMTIYLVFEALEKKEIQIDETIEYSALASEISTVNKVNTLFVKEGDKTSVEDAIKGLLVRSFNENAIVLAEKIADNEWEFVRKMNQKAMVLGLNNTAFRNASGLHHEGQYSTAKDLAKLAIRLKKDFPKYYKYFGLKEFKNGSKNYKSTNNFLKNYQGAEGMKTGYTFMSGYNLIGVASMNNKRFFSVVTGCKNSKIRDDLTMFLFDLAFN